MTRITIIVLVAMLPAISAACGDAGVGAVSVTPSAAQTTASQTATASDAGTTWLAVVEVAARADDLDALTQRLSASLGTALVVSPVSCIEGLPARAGDGYVIGAIATSAERAEGLVAEAGEQVSFTADVTIVCTD